MNRRKFIKNGLLWLPAVALYDPISARLSRAIMPGLMQMWGGSAATCDTSSMIWWWRAEVVDFSDGSGDGGNGETDYSVIDASAVGTVNNNAVCNAAAKKYGTNGLDIPAAWDYISFPTPSATWDDEGRLGFWIRPTTRTDDGVIIYLYGDANNHFRVRFDGTTELNWAWKDSSTARTEFATSGAGVAAGATWYWIEVAWKTSTNYREIFVNGVSKGSSAETIASFGVAVATMYFGDTTGIAQDLHMDNVIGGTVSTDDFYTVCKDELEWPE